MKKFIYLFFLLSFYSNSKDLIVSVIDTGVDLKEKKIQSKIWMNEKEKNGKKGIDDDQNGFIDDIHGWNFASNNADIYDEQGHGTHVAGIISKSLNKNFKLQILKFWEKNTNNMSQLKKSLYYASENKADIIVLALSGSEPDAEEHMILSEFKGLVFVASGNEKKDRYPASYNLANLFSVGNLSKKIKLHTTSNKAKNYFIGEDVEFNSVKLTGTSQATAVAVKDFLDKLNFLRK